MLSAKIEDQLIPAEGIENALSVWPATGISTRATLSTSGLKNIVLPPPPPAILITANHDAPGIDAAEKLVDRLLPLGCQIKIAKPTKKNSDFNDLLKENA